MNDWLEFLKQHQANISDNRVQNFGDQATEIKAAADGQTVLCEMSNMGLISVQGEEAESFLQNQFSNDVKQVTADNSQLNSYCTPKGRMLAMFRLFKSNDQYIMQLPVERVEPTLKRLRMFVLRTKALLSDASQEQVTFGVAGNDAAAMLSQHTGKLPENDNQVTAFNGGVVIKIPGTVPRYLLATNLEKAKTLWEALQKVARPCGHAVWSWLDIRAGIPQLYEPNVEAFVPQMMNLHSINGVSFQKGCYPGQEVVARMYYLGKLKRRMYLANIENDQKPQPGDLLFVDNDNSEQGTGRIVDAQPSPTGGYDALAVLQINSLDQSAIHLGKPDGPVLKFEELPYTVELERQK